MSDQAPSDFYNLMSGFTQEGTPLSAIIGSKLEWGVVTIAAGMLANHNLAATMTAEEMADAAINYYHVIQERIGYYNNSQTQSLEKLL